MYERNKRAKDKIKEIIHEVRIFKVISLIPIILE